MVHIVSQRPRSTSCPPFHQSPCTPPSQGCICIPSSYKSPPPRSPAQNPPRNPPCHHSHISKLTTWSPTTQEYQVSSWPLHTLSHISPAPGTSAALHRPTCTPIPSLPALPLLSHPLWCPQGMSYKPLLSSEPFSHALWLPPCPLLLQPSTHPLPLPHKPTRKPASWLQTTLHVPPLQKIAIASPLLPYKARRDIVDTYLHAHAAAKVNSL